MPVQRWEIQKLAADMISLQIPALEAEGEPRTQGELRLKGL